MNNHFSKRQYPRDQHGFGLSLEPHKIELSIVDISSNILLSTVQMVYMVLYPAWHCYIFGFLRGTHPNGYLAYLEAKQMVASYRFFLGLREYGRTLTFEHYPDTQEEGGTFS